MSTVKRGVKLCFPLLVARLLEWFTDMRKNKSMLVTSQCLLLMATPFEPEYLTGRSLDTAVEVANKYSRTITYNLEMVGRFAGIQGAGKYESVFNMDQTSIYIDMGPTRTIEFVGAKNVDVQKKACCDEERMLEWINDVCLSSSFLISFFVSVLFRCGNQVSLLLGCCYWTR
ncbi:hypothetical protein JG688_00014882 [Phytophthora aleatoria]|uniref:Uncharacterized protein n=1 Tax=Phytophthora aleatoria TaxID=2496075 RepID=A0A8J5IF89_9STRA|nr:hypothetical protein JG688_00014882 [Phytophthora aleatoria]